MLTDPNYETRTLLAPFDEGPVVHTFLRDTFFGAREYPPTNLVEFDFRRGRRKMAPFVAPLVGGKVMEREGYETRFFRAPRIAPVRNLRIPDLEPRMFGETIYSGRTPQDRAADLLAEDAVYCDEAISRREEWMCREVLVNGQLTITADHGYTMVVNFLENSTGTPADNHQAPANGTWDDINLSTPLTDLEDARLATIAASGVSPDVALFGTKAKEAFINNLSVQKLLDNRRFEMGNVKPVIQDSAVVLFATLPGLQCYVYAEYFEDDMGVLFPMLPENLVMLLSSHVQNKIVYGAFTQLEDVRSKRFVTYQMSRIPFVYGEEEDGQLFYRLTSCPLPMPNDVLGWRIIDALPATGTFGSGGKGRPIVEISDKGEGRVEGKTVEGRPYFAPTNETAHEKNMPEEARQIKEALGQGTPAGQPKGKGGGNKGKQPDYERLTVPELKDLAADRGLEVAHDARKDDIIDALKEDDKNHSA
jgi:hypothetical protein